MYAQKQKGSDKGQILNFKNVAQLLIETQNKCFI